MKIKKISAVVMTAAVLAAAAPISSVLPNLLGVTASAAEYKVGDEFYAATSSKGGTDWVLSYDDPEPYDSLKCKVLADGTLGVATAPIANYYGAHKGETIDIPRLSFPIPPQRAAIHTIYPPM